MTHPPHKLIVHFGQHKAMTVFFQNVFRGIAKKYGLYVKHHNGDVKGFYADVAGLGRDSIISVNNRPVDFSRLPPYVGSHIIRDPRDLLVSGYRYHLWCKELWATQPMHPKLLDSLKLPEHGVVKEIDGMSYQELLNSLSEEDGFLVELKRRTKRLRWMGDWDYANPRILELRYEEIFGNEVAIFERLFRHYGFDDRRIEKGLAIVERNSFATLQKTQLTGEGQHASVGASSQWRDRWNPKVKQAVKVALGDVIMKLRYETDGAW